MTHADVLVAKDQSPGSASRRLSRWLRRWVRYTAVGIGVMLGASFAPGVSAGSAAPTPPTCSGTPMLVTDECVDPTYNAPVIDSQTDLTSPVPLHLVSGHFSGTTGKFNIYLPKTGWQGRFFQYVYPLQTEDAINDPFNDPNAVSFGAASGAYTVQTNETGFGYRI